VVENAPTHHRYNSVVNNNHIEKNMVEQA